MYVFFFLVVKRFQIFVKYACMHAYIPFGGESISVARKSPPFELFGEGLPEHGYQAIARDDEGVEQKGGLMPPPPL